MKVKAVALSWLMIPMSLLLKKAALVMSVCCRRSQVFSGPIQEALCCHWWRIVDSWKIATVGARSGMTNFMIIGTSGIVVMLKVVIHGVTKPDLSNI
jgi:hypothetical protein